MSSLKSERPEWNVYVNEMIGAVAVYLSENDRKPLTNNEIIALTNFCCYISFNKWCFERGCGSEFQPKMKMIDLEQIYYSTWKRIEKKTSIIGSSLFTVYPLVNGLFSVISTFVGFPNGGLPFRPTPLLPINPKCDLSRTYW